jgi:hypothetical protein
MDVITVSTGWLLKHRQDEHRGRIRKIMHRRAGESKTLDMNPPECLNVVGFLSELPPYLHVFDHRYPSSNHFSSSYFLFLALFLLSYTLGEGQPKKGSNKEANQPLKRTRQQVSHMVGLTEWSVIKTEI